MVESCLVCFLAADEQTGTWKQDVSHAAINQQVYKCSTCSTDVISTSASNYAAENIYLNSRLNIWKTTTKFEMLNTLKSLQESRESLNFNIFLIKILLSGPNRLIRWTFSCSAACLWVASGNTKRNWFMCEITEFPPGSFSFTFWLQMNRKTSGTQSSLRRDLSDFFKMTFEW